MIYTSQIFNQLKGLLWYNHSEPFAFSNDIFPCSESMLLFQEETQKRGILKMFLQETSNNMLSSYIYADIFPSCSEKLISTKVICGSNV
jgi:hypothetical protein